MKEEFQGKINQNNIIKLLSQNFLKNDTEILKRFIKCLHKYVHKAGTIAVRAKNRSFFEEIVEEKADTRK